MTPDKIRQFLTVIINRRLFALDINNIIEILIPPKTTPIGDNLAEMGSTIFYKGVQIPLLPLERRLFKNPLYQSDDYRIVVIDINKRVVGFRVDSSEEILYINEKNIQSPG